MLLDESLEAISSAVRRDASVVDDLIEESRRRIAARNPGLGAIVATVPRPFRRGLDGPLAGVPLVLKDLQADAIDLPLTRGSALFAQHPAVGDSTVVLRLRDAGAVVLGRANTAEFGLNIVTEPRLFGPTRNPWNRDRSAGGSSGGSAAAVAAGMVPAAHATDSGGSTRIPAAWCGVMGFKPSRGLVPAGPWRLDDWNGLSHEHAITRSIADTRLILSVTAHPAPGEWQPHPRRWPMPSRPLRIGMLVEGPGGLPVASDYARAVGEVGEQLERAGHRVEPLSPIDDAASIGRLFGAIVSAHLAEIVSRVDIPDAETMLEPAVRELAQRGAGLSAIDVVRATRELHALGARLARAMSHVDVVLSPTTAWGPPTVGTVSTEAPASELFAEIFRLSPFAAMFNVTGGPAVSLPWGLDGEGLPIGVHLGAAPGHDELVLVLAELLETARPDLTRLVPPGYGAAG